MSSSSSAAPDSRSSSPPPTPDTFDFLDTAVIQTDFGLTSSAYISTHQSLMDQQAQLLLHSQQGQSQKTGDEEMLRLDELLEQHAYDDTMLASFHSMTGISNNMNVISPNAQTSTLNEAVLPDLTRTNVVIPPTGHMSGTKPIPPPATVPKKQDPSLAIRRVIYPPKESCYNLPIMVPSIPEGGTKSRVETQVRVTVDLADASSSSDPSKYNCVGSWKWLKLPPGTATKRRTRKQGKIDPDPQDILHLSVTVTCATPPHNRVLSCSSCQTREAKRVAKKLAARVRPARSDSESNDDPSSSQLKPKQIEDTTSIIQFNCPEVLDFNGGSVILPLRITCYCRHHREKVGFNVHFTMLDHVGRIVGTGSSRPIMITDDHKTVPAARQNEFANGLAAMNAAWQQTAAGGGGGMMTDFSVVDNKAPSKRKKEISSVPKRHKPYDSANKPVRSPPREGSVSSAASPSSTFDSLPLTRSPTPNTLFPGFPSEPPMIQPTPGLQHCSQISDSSTSDALITPLDQSPRISMSKAPIHPEVMHTPSPPMNPASVVMPAHPHPIPFMFFDSPSTTAMQVPMIHRLIPAMGPTHGGIEVTILGANFHASLQLTCVFGDVAASMTQRWSDNTLVCILPPRATAGVVAVWFDGFPQNDQVNPPTCLFTYADESDRALMELALQVVGLKMTGKIEDAKNVAMRIVGGPGGDNTNNHNGNSNNAMQLAASLSSTKDLLPLLLARRAGENDDFESLIVDFLAVLEAPLEMNIPDSISTAKACSHTTPGGQTLMHLGAFLGFSSLLSFLIKHGVDLDARDKNGYTALHFAALSKSEEAARIMIVAGADTEIVNALGKTAAECAPELKDVFSTGTPALVESDSDEEAGWGDVEEDDETPVPRRTLRKRNIRRRGPRANVTEKMSGAESSESSDAFDDAKNKDKNIDGKNTDEKQAASFLEMLQRKFAMQLPVAQGIIPNIPQLPLPHLPNLPPMPTLPQLPMVFPVYVPMMPGLPAFLGGEHGASAGKDEGTDAVQRPGPLAARAALEWRATWERLIGLAIATPRGDDAPPPMYTPREDGKDAAMDEKSEASTSQQEQATSGSATNHRPTDIRPIGYNSTPVPEQEINSYDYKPSSKRQQKLQKKHDKMLLIFWLPILFMSLLWAIYTSIQFTFQTVRTFFPKTSFV